MRIETRGPEVGVCNICGNTARLTDDHIPPKGVPLVGQAFLQRLTDSLGAEPIRKSSRFFQRGVKYRSLCVDCNTNLLGRQYDPSLIEFCRSIHATLPNRVHLQLTLRPQLNKVIRSLVGHLLAHGVETHRLGKIQSSLTDYLLSESETFPSELCAYLWIYPYKPQIVAPGVGSLFDFRKASPFIFSLIKFYPIAFMCSANELPQEQSGAITRIDKLTTCSIAEPIDVTLSISRLPSPRWPEALTKDGVVFHVGSSTIAKPVQT